MHLYTSSPLSDQMNDPCVWARRSHTHPLCVWEENTKVSCLGAFAGGNCYRPCPVDLPSLRHRASAWAFLSSHVAAPGPCLLPSRQRRRSQINAGSALGPGQRGPGARALEPWWRQWGEVIAASIEILPPPVQWRGHHGSALRTPGLFVEAHDSATLFPANCLEPGKLRRRVTFKFRKELRSAQTNLQQ